VAERFNAINAIYDDIPNTVTRVVLAAHQNNRVHPSDVVSLNESGLLRASKWYQRGHGYLMTVVTPLAKLLNVSFISTLMSVISSIVAFHDWMVWEHLTSQTLPPRAEPQAATLQHFLFEVYRLVTELEIVANDPGGMKDLGQHTLESNAVALVYLFRVNSLTVSDRGAGFISCMLDKVVLRRLLHTAIRV
jgi:hypothetical protein